MVTVVESADQLTNYRHLVTLPDGLRVLLRPLVPKDRDAAGGPVRKPATGRKQPLSAIR